MSEQLKIKRGDKVFFTTFQHFQEKPRKTWNKISCEYDLLALLLISINVN